MKKLILAFLLTFSSVLKADLLPLDTVAHVDLERYLGTWYEIARFDHSFERGCTATKAVYSKRSDGDIQVVNSCYLGNPEGELKQAIGRAWVADEITNAKLKVQFFMPETILPELAGDYWILALDANYQYALIGEPKREHLWILSRTQEIDEVIYEELVDKAQEAHFDVSKLIRTIH